MEGAPNSLSLPTLKQWGTLVSHRSASKVEVLLVNKGVFTDEGLDVVTTILEKLSGGPGEIPNPDPDPVTQVSCSKRGKVAEGSLVLNLEIPFEGWVEVIAQFYGTTADEIYGGTRIARVSTARHVLMFLFRKSLLSWHEIATLVRVRSHKSAMHGFKMISEQVESRTGVYTDLEEVLGNIESKGVPCSAQDGQMELSLEVVAPAIISAVANYYKVSVDDIMSRSRLAHIVKARHVSIFLIKKKLGLSQKNIAKIMGLVDHTTVGHAIGKIEEWAKKDRNLRSELSAVFGRRSKSSQDVR